VWTDSFTQPLHHYKLDHESCPVLSTRALFPTDSMSITKPATRFKCSRVCRGSHGKPIQPFLSRFSEGAMLLHEVENERARAKHLVSDGKRDEPDHSRLRRQFVVSLLSSVGVWITVSENFTLMGTAAQLTNGAAKEAGSTVATPIVGDSLHPGVE
jgi:hypothetical protein